MNSASACWVGVIDEKVTNWCTFLNSFVSAAGATT